jgi:hypothetical protein
MEMGMLIQDPSMHERARRNIIAEYERSMNGARRRIAISDWQFRRHLNDHERIEWLNMDEEAKELRTTAKRNVRQRMRKGQSPNTSIASTNDNIETEEIVLDEVPEEQPEESIQELESPLITSMSNMDISSDDISPIREHQPPQLVPEEQQQNLSQEIMDIDQESDTQPSENLMIDVPESQFEYEEADDQLEYLSDEEIIDENPFLDLEGEFILPLDISLEHSIMGPVITQYRSINKAFTTVLFQKQDLMEHFEAARHYLLVRNSDWGRELVNSLSTHNGMSDHLVRLNDALERSLQDSECWDEDPLCKNLIFERRDGVNKPLIWDSLDTLTPFQLKYRCQFPINLILDEDALNEYESVFQFMIKLKRTEWNIREIWIMFKHSEARKKDIRELHLFAREIQHVVEAISNYVATHVIATATLEFERKIKMNDEEDTSDEEDINLQSLIKHHQDFLLRVTRGCLLHEQTRPLLDVLLRIFKTVLTFYVQLQHNPPSFTIHHTPYQAMMRTRDEFRDDVLLLCTILDKLLYTSGDSREEDDRLLSSSSNQLGKLLLLLDYNRYYREQM